MHAITTLEQPDRQRAVAAIPNAVEGFDNYARIAARLTGANGALITIVEPDQQRVLGIYDDPNFWNGEYTTPLSHSICKYVAAGGAPVRIDDMWADEFLAHQPASVDLGIRSYLGVPLTLESGSTVGSLCVLDVYPRQWMDVDVAHLADLAGLIVRDLSTREDDGLQALVESLPHVSYVLEEEPEWRFRYVSSQLEQQLGYCPGEWTASFSNFLDRVHSEDLARLCDVVESAIRDRSPICALNFRIYDAWGNIKWLQNSAVLTSRTSEQGTIWQGMLQDVTDKQGQQSVREYQSQGDLLTGLPDRPQAIGRLSELLVRSDDFLAYPAIMIIDLDNFASINQRFGYAIGDDVLVAIVNRLRHAVTRDNLVARFGGDAILILLEGPDSRFDSVAPLLDLLTEIIRAPVLVDGHSILVTSSIGIGNRQRRNDTADDLLRYASVALAHAKELGKDRWIQFDRHLHSLELRRIELTNDLRSALEAPDRGAGLPGEFHLDYQPIVSLESGERVLVEALLRWRHPRFGRLQPAEFIPLAEDSGLIVPLGAGVLAQACEEIQVWDRDGRNSIGVGITINISARQFWYSDIIGEIDRAISRSNIDPTRLVIEITENAIMENLELVSSKLMRLKEIGVRVAVDDFGVGQSSLWRLRNLPVDMLKIDRQFTQGLDDENSHAVVSAIVSLGRALGLQVVAEGVETDEQRQILIGIGCDLAQGFYFGMPEPLGAASDWPEGTTASFSSNGLLPAIVADDD